MAKNGNCITVYKTKGDPLISAWDAAGTVAPGIYSESACKPNFLQVENPARFARGPRAELTKAMTWNFLAAYNAYLLLNPSVLRADYSHGTIPLIDSERDARNLASTLLWLALLLLALLALLRASLAPPDPALLLAVAFLVVPFIPSSNLFFPVGFVVAERVLYMPSLGFCMLLALSLEALDHHPPPSSLEHDDDDDNNNDNDNTNNNNNNNQRRASEPSAASAARQGEGGGAEARGKASSLQQRLFSLQQRLFSLQQRLFSLQQRLFAWPLRRKVARGSVAAIVVLYAGRTWVRNYDWVSREAFYGAMVRDNPTNPKAHYGYGNIVINDVKRLEVGERHLLEASRLQPNYFDAYNDLGAWYNRNGQYEKAKAQFEWAVKAKPEHINGLSNQGLNFLSMQDWENAFLVFDKAVEYFPDSVDFYNNMGMALQGLKMPEDALQAYSDIIVLDPVNPRSYYLYAIAAGQAGRSEEAEVYFRNAIRIRPWYVDALFNLGVCLMKQERMEEAYAYFLRVNYVNHNHPGLKQYMDILKGL